MATEAKNSIVESTHVQYIEMDCLMESSTNPRQVFDADYLAELQRSIAEQGILQPILVRPIPVSEGFSSHFEIVDGACRYRAAKALLLPNMPALVQPMDDEHALEAQLVANLQRKDVHAIEEAEGFARLLAMPNMSQRIVADRVGKKERYVRERMVLNNLVDKVRDAFRKNKIQLGHAFQIARMPHEEQVELLKWATEHRETALPANRLHEHIVETYMLTLKKASWEMDDAELFPAAGPCTTCPKRTGNDHLLFADVNADDTCTDAVCFHKKQENVVLRAFSGHEERAKLSIVPGYEQKAKGLRDWKTTAVVASGGKKRECEYTKEGVVVENTLHEHHMDTRRDLKVGAVVKFCAEPKCKVHNLERRVSDNYTSGRTEAYKKQERERKLELQRRARAIHALASGVAVIPEDDELWKVIDLQVRELGNDNARAFCKAMDWVPKKIGTFGANWREIIRKRVHAEHKDNPLHWVLVLACVGYDAWFMAGPHKLKTTMLDDALRSRKIAVPKLEEKKPPKAIAKKEVRRVTPAVSKTKSKTKAATASAAAD